MTCLGPLCWQGQGHSAIVLDQKQAALWRVAQEALTVEIAEEGGVAMVELRTVQHMSCHP
jgi:hypothetical protein